MFTMMALLVVGTPTDADVRARAAMVMAAPTAPCMCLGDPTSPLCHCAPGTCDCGAKKPAAPTYHWQDAGRGTYFLMDGNGAEVGCLSDGGVYFVKGVDGMLKQAHVPSGMNLPAKTVIQASAPPQVESTWTPPQGNIRWSAPSRNCGPGG